MINGLAAMASALSYTKTRESVSTELLKMGKEQIEQRGEDIQRLMASMELSVNPSVGGQFDLKI